LLEAELYDGSASIMLVGWDVAVLQASSRSPILAKGGSAA